MAKKVTTWTPDTCGCTVHYEWDDAVPQELRIHTPVDKVVTHDGKQLRQKVCPIHAIIDPSFGDLGNHVAHYNVVHEENTRKNKVLGHILETQPKIVDQKMDEDGNIVKEFKRGMTPEWSFDSQRNLVVKMKGSNTKGEIDSLNTAAKQISEKVVIT